MVRFQSLAALCLLVRLNGGEVGIVASSMDSGLEAFYRYPADDSFAALAFQPTANTKYLQSGLTFLN
jgi:hypothetical protein